MSNLWNFPDLGIGVGLRTVHFGHILAHWPQVDFFEILTENFLDTGGRPSHLLNQISERYPIVMHGVSMSIGSMDPLDWDYLRKVKELAERTRAHWISDHVCWTGVNGRNVHDLLPVPYTEEALEHMIGRVRAVSRFLGRPLVLENPTTYLEFASSTISEWEFLARLLEGADCGLLLDVNNVYVSAFNHGYDAKVYLDALPPERVVQYHLAGHTNRGTHIIDSHSDHVIDAVWELFGHAVARTGPRATLLEWDAEIPPFEVVHAEARKAAAWRQPNAPAETSDESATPVR